MSANDSHLESARHRLETLGYYRNGTNENEASAIKNFQTANGLDVSGKYDAATIELLLHGESCLSQQAYLESCTADPARDDVLHCGDTGENVLHLQQRLKALGFFSGSCDGYFAPETCKAVMCFQLANGLEMSGNAGTSELKRLDTSNCIDYESFVEKNCCRPGDTGSAVHFVACALRMLGYSCENVTTSYNETLKSAVRQFCLDQNIDASEGMNNTAVRQLIENLLLLKLNSEDADYAVDDDELVHLCELLKRNGYPAHAEYDLQSELALMEFCFDEGLPIESIYIEECLEMLEDASTRTRNAADNRFELDSSARSNIAQTAESLIGKKNDFNEVSGLVQYCYLKNGFHLDEMELLPEISVNQSSIILPGDIVRTELDGNEIYGIVQQNGLLIYAAPDGYIVRSVKAITEMTDVMLCVIS